MMDAVLFWTFAPLAIIMALGVVFSSSVLYSALCLLGVFVSIAAFFALNNADFLAVAQVLVYAVGLTIVILFGIMFTGRQLTFGYSAEQFKRRSPYMLIAGLLALGLVAAYLTGQMPFEVASEAWLATLKSEGTTRALGTLLFSKYVLPFELVSILLLVAMMGAIVLSRKKLEPAKEGLVYEQANSEPIAPSTDVRRAVGYHTTPAGEAGLKVSDASDAENVDQAEPVLSTESVGATVY